jgi:site-specific recombinase XerD
MTIKETITLFGYHQRSSQKPRTIQSYRPLLQNIEGRFAGRPFDSIGSDEIYHLLETLTEAQSKSTRRLRYAQMKAFYNFLIEKSGLNLSGLYSPPLAA